MRLPTLAAALVMIGGACTAPPDAPPDPHALPLLGMAPVTPLEKVSFTLTDLEGHPFDFRAETDGYITLLFFGYTYCPDICPIHMATLASAMDRLDPEVRDRVRMVFVSVDPERDTPEHFGRWLHAFDSSFVGLRGELDELAEILAFYRYPPPETSGEPTGYTVGHPSVVYAFTPDNLGRALYGVETTRAAWVHDLNLMAEHDWPVGAEPGALPPEGTLVGAVGPLEIFDAVAPAPPTGDRTAVYFTIRNAGPAGDTLVSIATDAAGEASVHDMTVVDGMMRMVPMDGLYVPAGETVRLAPGGKHGMLEALVRPLEPGERIDITLHFARFGTVTIPVRVVRYEDLITG